jgi:hypothetical protein
MQPTRWSDRLLGLGIRLLATALMLYLAVKLILAVLPFVVAFGAVGLVGFVGWSVYSRHRSGW